MSVLYSLVSKAAVVMYFVIHLLSVVPLFHCALEYTFRVSPVPDHPLHRPDDPLSHDFHMTRYNGVHGAKEGSFYNHLIPWILRFDFIVEPCKGGGTCVYSVRQTPKPSTNRTFFVHIHSDYRHHKYFIQTMLPFFKSRWEILHGTAAIFSGGGDVSVSPHTSEVILSQPWVVRWGIQQNQIASIQSDSRVVEIPIGLNPRENFGTFGVHLRQLIRSARNESSNTSTSSVEANWMTRKDRILVCFGTSFAPRKRYHDWALSNCSVCDVCRQPKSSNATTETSSRLAGTGVGAEINSRDPTEYAMTHSELWQMYTEYKFILSPVGNGVDCGRTWEIMLMGAIPVIPHWAGLRGYEQANLSVISIAAPENLTEANVNLWKSRFSSGGGNDLSKLSHAYWAKIAFDGIN